MSFISVQDPAREFESAAPITSRPALPQRFLATKRIFDLALCILLMPLAALACLVVAALNPFLNPGPLLFSQIRIGQDEKPFRIYKLRTMLGAAATARFATDEAHRITRFGAFLRAKRIDELPQLVNILMGQMSFIGPRPEQPGFYDEFARTIPGYQTRQIVKPGLSGLAQVEAGYAADANGTRTKLRYDMHYIRNMGVNMDLYVIGRTFNVVVTGFGAR